MKSLFLNDEDLLELEELIGEEYLNSIRLLVNHNSPKANERCRIIQKLHTKLIKMREIRAVEEMNNGK
jgi:hypothetical protein